MTWHLGALAAFDTETTGTNPDEARLVTAVVARLHGASQHEPAVTSWLVNPGVDIPDAAAAVHGITTEHAREHGGDPAVTCLEVAEALAACWAEGRPVIAHNAPYDLTVLDRELRRHHGEALVIAGPVIDTLVLDKMVDRYRKGKRTLEATAAHYGVRLDGAHDAGEDALAAARIAWAIAQREAKISGSTLVELHGALQAAAADQAASFRAYKAKRGESTDGISGEWPIRAYIGQVAA